MVQKKYGRLSQKERTIIETLLQEKRKKVYIAKVLNRSRSTITREINLWVRNPEDSYDASLAHWYAQDENNSKRLADKLTTYPKLKLSVYRGLLHGDSPELISGRLRLLYHDNAEMQISHESIYRHIYTHPQGVINKKLIKLLVRHKPRRKQNKSKGKKICIKDRVSIDTRPQYVDTRLRIGDWEGDLLIGPYSCIGSLVERKTRYVILVKLPDKKSKSVTEAFAARLNELAVEVRVSMTYDNGTEMANHKWFSSQTGMQVYFAHPYSSWERGSNENTNGLVRRYYPKKTDFNKVTELELQQLQDRLNNRPRKVLGYYTANEMLQKELQKIQKR